jgi:hypothetical protein
MRRIVVVLALVLAGMSIPRADAKDAGASGIPSCMQVTTESRYVPYGYNHIVHLKNGCSKAATCKVSTDVNPDVQTVEVPSSTSVEVLTYMAANAQTFVARVTCTLK